MWCLCAGTGRVQGGGSCSYPRRTWPRYNCLRAPYKIRSTELWYRVVSAYETPSTELRCRVPGPNATPGTDQAYGTAIPLWMCYGMSGTDGAYGATRCGWCTPGGTG
eukprot:1982551-Rhodomonas_salina.1